jgi:hypothetical protein
MITELIREQQDYFNYLNNLKNKFDIECELIPILRDISYRIKALSTLYANGDIDNKFFEKEMRKNEILAKKYIPSHIKYKINTYPKNMGIILLDKEGHEYPIY